MTGVKKFRQQRRKNVQKAREARKRNVKERREREKSGNHEMCHVAESPTTSHLTPDGSPSTFTEPRILSAETMKLLASPKQEFKQEPDVPEEKEYVLLEKSYLEEAVAHLSCVNCNGKLQLFYAT